MFRRLLDVNVFKQIKLNLILCVCHKFLHGFQIPEGVKLYAHSSKVKVELIMLVLYIYVTTFSTSYCLGDK